MPIYKMNGKKDGLQKYRVRINYTDNSGANRQIERVAYGMDAAKRMEQQLLFNLKDETRVKITFNALFEEYINSKKYELRETTIHKSRDIITRYVLPTFHDTRIDRINLKTLQAWKNSIEEHKTDSGGKLSIVTKQNIYATFSAVLNYAVNMDYISQNLLAKLGNFKSAYESKQEMHFYTAEQFLKYIDMARKSAEDYEQTHNSIAEWHYYVFFMIAFYTGMRKGEINALRWTDIDGEYINVTRSIAQKLKGDDRETPPKNKSSIRTLQMPKPLILVLTAHKERCMSLNGFSENQHICGGVRCLRDTTIDKKNRQYAKAANLEPIRIHDFRHSHVSLLANEGINIQEIARRLGHSRIEMTWNTYAHLYPREEERAVNILNRIQVIHDFYTNK